MAVGARRRWTIPMKSSVITWPHTDVILKWALCPAKDPPYSCTEQAPFSPLREVMFPARGRERRVGGCHPAPRGLLLALGALCRLRLTPAPAPRDPPSPSPGHLSTGSWRWTAPRTASRPPSARPASCPGNAADRLRFRFRGTSPEFPEHPVIPACAFRPRPSLWPRPPANLPLAPPPGPEQGEGAGGSGVGCCKGGLFRAPSVRGALGRPRHPLPLGVHP